MSGTLRRALRAELAQLALGLVGGVARLARRVVRVLGLGLAAVERTACVLESLVRLLGRRLALAGDGAQLGDRLLGGGDGAFALGALLRLAARALRGGGVVVPGLLLA